MESQMICMSQFGKTILMQIKLEICLFILSPLAAFGSLKITICVSWVLKIMTDPS